MTGNDNQPLSPAELQQHLNEKLVSSASFLTLSTAQQRRPRPEVAEALSYLTSSPLFSGLLSLVRKTLFESLLRLNQHPRTDQFWRNTNFRPTIYKLREFSQAVLKNDAKDELALLTLVSLDVIYAIGFSAATWVSLYQRKAVSIDMVLFAALLSEVDAGTSSTEFCTFVRETGSATVIEEHLREIARHGGRLLTRWSLQVEACL